MTLKKIELLKEDNIKSLDKKPTNKLLISLNKIDNLRLKEKNFRIKLPDNQILQVINKKSWDLKSNLLKRMFLFLRIILANSNHDMQKKWASFQLIKEAKFRNCKRNKKEPLRKLKKVERIKYKPWTVDLRKLKEIGIKLTKNLRNTSKCITIWTSTLKTQLKVRLPRREDRAVSMKRWLQWSSQ